MDLEGRRRKKEGSGSGEKEKEEGGMMRGEGWMVEGWQMVERREVVRWSG